MYTMYKIFSQLIWPPPHLPNLIFQFNDACYSLSVGGERGTETGAPVPVTPAVRPEKKYQQGASSSALHFRFWIYPLPFGGIEPCRKASGERIVRSKVRAWVRSGLGPYPTCALGSVRTIAWLHCLGASPGTGEPWRCVDKRVTTGAIGNDALAARAAGPRTSGGSQGLSRRSLDSMAATCTSESSAAPAGSSEASRAEEIFLLVSRRRLAQRASRILHNQFYE